MGNDHVYWAFSAAAQSIAAFVALLLAGFALVHSLMESVREKDDSLEEVNVALRRRYHRNLSRIAWITGAAIVLSLGMAFANRWVFVCKLPLMGAIALLDAVALGAGLWFAVSVVNPRRYEKQAEALLKSERANLGLSGELAPTQEFFEAFRRLEIDIREDLRRKGIYEASADAPKMSFSFRRMVDALFRHKHIDKDLHQELLAVNKYRNLVFHGHEDRADRGMITRAREAHSHFCKSIDGDCKLGPLPPQAAAA